MIVNYNTSALLRDPPALGVAQHGQVCGWVFVVDNASPDDSVAMVRAEFLQVLADVLANLQNVGYLCANNAGLTLLRLCGFARCLGSERKPGVSALQTKTAVAGHNCRVSPFC